MKEVVRYGFVIITKLQTRGIIYEKVSGFNIF